jgi:hypothetical protein
MAPQVFNAIPDALAVKMNPALHMLLTLKRVSPCSLLPLMFISKG